MQIKKCIKIDFEIYTSEHLNTPIYVIYAAQLVRYLNV